MSPLLLLLCYSIQMCILQASDESVCACACAMNAFEKSVHDGSRERASEILLIRWEHTASFSATNANTKWPQCNAMHFMDSIVAERRTLCLATLLLFFDIAALHTLYSWCDAVAAKPSTTRAHITGRCARSSDSNSSTNGTESRIFHLCVSWKVLVKRWEGPRERESEPKCGNLMLHRTEIESQYFPFHTRTHARNTMALHPTIL